MKFKKHHMLGIIAGIIIIIVDIIFLRDLKIFYFIFGISIILGALPFIFSLIQENNEEKENNEMFLEFSRNLVESVKAGTPISKSIINMRSKDFGSLTPYVQKLANQISIGIPVKESLEIFARDINSEVVFRAVNLISEAEKAGGEIEGILESVAKSVSEIDELKKEREAAIYSLVVQGYIIFLIFIVIMLIMQFKILPMSSELSYEDTASFGGFNIGSNYSMEEVSRPMLYLLLTQGLFTGLLIGKLAEGSIKQGIKHSFIMVTLAILIYTGARAFF